MTRTTRNTRRAVTYSRVSRLNGRSGDSFHSLDEQHDTNEQLVRKHDLKHVAHFEDVDVSGATIDRPEFLKALAMIENGQADTLVVARLTRFSRSVSGAHAALERIVDAGGTLIIGDLGIDTKSKTGKMLFSILSAVAEFELDVKREGWLDARARATKLKRKMSAAPLGYTDNRALVPHELYGELVTGVFERRAAGASWGTIREWWHDETERRTGKGEWRGVTTFASLVKNRAYLGELRNGDDHVVADAHEPLVDLDTFERAQSSEERPRAPRRDGSLLAGVATCGTCGGKLTHQRGRYVCQRSNRTGVACDRGVTIQAAKLDAYVERELLAWAEGYERETVVDNDAAAIRKLDVTIGKLEQRRASVSAKLADLDVDEDSTLASLAAIDAKLAETRETRDEFVSTKRVAGHRQTFAEAWAQAKDDGDLDGMRACVAGAVESLTIAPTSRKGEQAKTHAKVEDRAALRFRRDDEGAR